MSKKSGVSEEEARIAAEVRAAEERGEDPLGLDDEPEVDTIEAQAARAQAALDKANGSTDPAAIAADDADDDADPDSKPPSTKDKVDPTDPVKEGDPKKEPTAEETAAAEAAAAEAAPADDTAPADEEPADEDVALEPRGWTGKPIADMQKRDGEIAVALADAFKKHSGGDLDDEEYLALVQPLQAEQRTLDRTISRAESAQETLKQYEEKVLEQVSRDALKAGIKYLVSDKDTPEAQKAASKASKQYDALLNTIMSDPDNARRSFRSMAREANAQVMALRGIAKAKTTTAPAPAPAADTKPPARAQAGKPPTTLRQIPAAATASATGASSIEEQAKTLKGPAYQAFYSKLTQSQKDKLKGDLD